MGEKALTGSRDHRVIPTMEQEPLHHGSLGFHPSIFMHTRSCFQPGCSGVPRCSWHSLFPCCSKPHSPAPPGSLPVCCFSVQEKHPQNCKTHTFSHNPLHHPTNTTKIFYCVPRLTQSCDSNLRPCDLRANPRATE